MKITKLGHCCLLVEEKATRILTDPGAYSNAQDSLQGLDAVLITHEHRDHLHIESLIKVLANNPQAKVFSNKSVGELLKKENILFEVLEENSPAQIKGTEILAFNAPHEFIADSVVLPENTALLIGRKLFFPGDSFFIPEKEIKILALPVAGPWMKLKEAIAYAKKVKPKKAFPVHDGMLRIIGPTYKVPQQELGEAGIEFLSLEAGQSAEF
jgi:L-ascorbate metabolism protein UlaG (beta-lactamase superfamily)